MSEGANLVELYGTAVPPAARRTLRAGPLAAELEAGNLRYLTFGGTEILRAVSFVVRDRDWGTYAPEISDLAVSEGPDAFAVRYGAVCRGRSLLRYRARIEGKADGSLRFEAEAVPEGDFETNRCGFVVLHPAAAAGASATIEHVDGSREATAFPELIDPWRPFVSIREITHRADGLEVTCRLEGEEFEMEDQRNWSDASFKTYGRPLELPWPYVLPAGERVAQSVAVSVRLVGGAARESAAEGPVAVEIGVSLGVRFPEVGLVVTAAEVPAALAALDRLKEVGPQRILCAFDPTAVDGSEALAAFARLQAAYPAAYDLECVVVGKGDLGAELAGVARGVADAGLELATVAVCPSVDRRSTPPGSKWPDCPPLEEIYAAARAAFPGVTLGGGMFSYFTELNRKRPPVALLDFVTHATNPIVHAADDDSVMETLETLPHITRSTRAIVGALPYRIGPSSIAMRQNPYGSRTIPNPKDERVAMADDDPRQRGRFAAAWTAGYAAAIAPAGAAVWVPAAFVGPRGLLDAGGALLPVGEVVRDLARLAGCEVLAAEPALARRFAVLAVQDGGMARTVLANLAPEALACELREARTLAAFEVLRCEVEI
jgi:hypothetical protein